MFATLTLAAAAGAASAGPSGGSAAFLSSGLLPMILIFVIFWFLLIRPQQKQMKEHRAKVAGVKKGDGVVTGGGLIGKVTKVDDDTVEIEIASGVKVKAVKATLSDVNPLAPAKPAND